VDLGVMVSCEKILEAAKKENADIIGLSGLITPSLDEMVHVAKEMQRQNFSVPLLIGGATTSKVHTAVKIEPNYTHPVVHVNDASRSVTVVSSLISESQREEFVGKVREEYHRLREYQRNANTANKFIPLEDARKNKLNFDWSSARITEPKFLGNKVFNDYSLAEIATLIDWTPFFHSWEMKGSYPKIFNDPERGAEAKKLFDDAQAMLKKIIDEKWLTANAVVGIYEANADQDDIIVYNGNGKEKTKFHTLRQQTKKPEGQANIALADFVAPKGTKKDYIGAFAVTTGIGIEKWVEKFEKDHDDYNAIMVKALADRLAEAFAELMHLKVRKEFWAYASDEQLSNDALIREEYTGIRPAPGYPAQPDHTEKPLIWKLLDVEKNTGIKLTESMAMYPTAAVSGLYFANPHSHYFGLGKIAKDQVEEYAKRKGMKLEEIERWLGTVINY
jgi:5-methyltetrahydrofolate--homocysteine methyltransferase